MSHIRLDRLGWVTAKGALVVILSSLICSQAAADVRPIPDAGITEKTVILVPNHDFYRVSGAIHGARKRAPFGSGGTCPLQTTVNSSWPVGTSIVLRKSFTLPAGASNLRVLLSVDNDARVFLNGTRLTPVLMHEFCPIVDEFLVAAPDALLIAGTNRLVIRATDRGAESYLDLRVLVDLP